MSRLVTPHELSRQALVEIVSGVQALLYLDVKGEREFWNPGKEWTGADVCDSIQDLLHQHGLVPGDEQPCDIPRRDVRQLLDWAKSKQLQPDDRKRPGQALLTCGVIWRGVFYFRTLCNGGYAKMTRRVNQVLWGQWRQRLERQRVSGLSIAGFCRKEGVSTVTFHTWKRKLQAEAAAQQSRAETTRGSRPAERSAAVPPRRRVRPARAGAGTMPPTASFLQVPIVAARWEPCVELTLVDGTLVRIPAQHLAALQMVFTILRGGAVPATDGEVPHA